jgi:histidinol dehydrogenase
MEVPLFRLSHMTAVEKDRLCVRTGVDLKDLVALVTPLVERVRQFGDEAVRELTRKFDGVDLPPTRFRVAPEELKESVKRLSPELREAMHVSIANIKRFHETQFHANDWQKEFSPGFLLGEKTISIPSVGLYVPRGKGSFPSMMMMAGVPAKVAGVKRIVVVTPPDSAGLADQATLAVAELIGIDEVYAVGGVQAIAALALGTETIPRVSKIVGPGSGYVLAAKQVVSAYVDTGLPAGPSESIILADSTADPVMAVIDLLIEAEHGPDSSAYLVTMDTELAAKALELIPPLISSLPEPKASFCREVFRSNGGVVLASDMDEAVDFINTFAPEHLQVLIQDPAGILDKVKYAGEVLLGSYTPGTLANYSLGPNAILPTSGFARTSSSLSAWDFTRKMSYSMLDEKAFRELAPKTLLLAEYEGFSAHARALKYRLQ